MSSQLITVPKNILGQSLPKPAKIEIGLLGRQRDIISLAIASEARSKRSDAVTFSFSIVALSIARIVSLLKILGLLTINLGVFNLLPIPALDGSKIWFLLVEWIRKKPIKHEALVHSIGMMILFAFMILIVFKDLWVWIFE